MGNLHHNLQLGEILKGYSILETRFIINVMYVYIGTIHVKLICVYKHVLNWCSEVFVTDSIVILR